jgi:hypothetical protein
MNKELNVFVGPGISPAKTFPLSIYDSPGSVGLFSKA